MLETVSVELSNFDSCKRKILNATIDLSRKGSVDVLAEPIVVFLNQKSNFVTTSSCSGRFIIFRDHTEHQFADIIHEQEDSDSVNRKKGCDWKYVTHDTISLEEVKSVVQENQEKNLTIKFEPFILHVQAKTLEAAQLLLSCGVQSGFRESGISFRQKNNKINKIVVAVRSTHGLEVPLHPSLVTEQYIDYIVKRANAMINENVQRIDRLFENLKKTLQ